MKEKAIEILQQLQKDNPFIKAIYLWGSITTDEYIEGKSDIDAIAFVDGATDSSEKDKINEVLNKELAGLRINFLYESELNDGPSKSGLTKVIHPAVILYDFPAWIHVSGVRYKKEDFSSGRISLEEIINISTHWIQKRFLPVPEEKDYVYFIKAVAKLLYFKNQKGSSFKPFRYADLIVDSDSEDRDIATLILELKKSNWNYMLLNREMPHFVSLLG